MNRSEAAHGSMKLPRALGSQGTWKTPGRIGSLRADLVSDALGPFRVGGPDDAPGADEATWVAPAGESAFGLRMGSSALPNGLMMTAPLAAMAAGGGLRSVRGRAPRSRRARHI